MAYRLPNFNLSARIWTGGSTPSGGAPTLTGIPCQLYVHSKGVYGDFPVGTFQTIPTILFRFPVGLYAPAVGDIIDSVSPINDYYLVGFSQKIHAGFPNQYLLVSVLQCDQFGVTPRP